ARRVEGRQGRRARRARRPGGGLRAPARDRRAARGHHHRRRGGRVSPKVVIFDFGGVFIDSPFSAALDVAAARGIDPEAMLLTLFGAYDDDTDHPWHRLERGEITFDRARAEIRALSTRDGGPALDAVEVLAELSGGGVRDEVV